MDLQERNRLRYFLHSPILSMFLLIMVVLLINSNYHIYKKNQMAKMNRDESDRRLALLREKNNRLEIMLKKLRTERGVEEELRNKFQITKSGEEVLVVVDQDGPLQVGNYAAVSRYGSYWQRLKSFFGL